MSKKTDTLTIEIDSLGQFGTRLSPQGFGRAELTRLSHAGKALRDIINTDTGEAADRRAQRISRASQNFRETVTRLKHELTEREMAGRVTLHEQFKQHLGTEPDRYAAEIVSVFRSANPTQKAEMLAEIAKSGDGRSLAALESAPAFVHGVDGEVMRRYRTVMEYTHAPEVSERRDYFLEDVNTVQAALAQATGIAERAADLDANDFAQAAEDMADAEARLADATAA